MNADSVQPTIVISLKHFIKIVDLSLPVITKTKLYLRSHSRCTVVDFKIVNGQRVKTATAFLKD